MNDEQSVNANIIRRINTSIINQSSTPNQFIETTKIHYQPTRIKASGQEDIKNHIDKSQTEQEEI